MHLEYKDTDSHYWWPQATAQALVKQEIELETQKLFYPFKNVFFDTNLCASCDPSPSKDFVIHRKSPGPTDRLPRLVPKEVFQVGCG